MADDNKPKTDKDRSKGDEAGEDEGGVPTNGDDENVKEDQKPITK